MTRARDLADSADKDIAGTLVVDDITASGTITGDTAGTHTGAVTGNVTGNLTGDVTGNTAGTHTGAVVGNVTGDLTGNVTGDVIDEANLKVSNAPTNGYFLSAQSGNTGGLTWATPPSGYADSDVDAHLLTAGVTLDATNDRLGINSTGPTSTLHVLDSGANSGSLRVGGSGASLGLELTYDQSGATTSIIQANPTYTSASQLLKIRTDGDLNTDQLVLKGNGYVGIGVSPAYPLHVYGDRSADFVSEIRNTGTNGPYGQLIRFSGAAPDNNTRHFAYYTDITAVRFVVDSDGDVKNHDNSYGALSDQRIKESISDATSQWDDIKALKVRKFKLKDDIRQYGDDAKFKIGLVSQEAELVSPNLITENAANPNDIVNSSEFGTLYTKDDDETKDAVLYTSDDEEVKRGDKEVGDIKIPSTKEVGAVKERKTTVKGIRYSILYMKAVKALQEAMARIETLETQSTAQATQIADLTTRLEALEAN